MISIVICSVYPGAMPMQLRSLAAQSCQDFELVFVDAYHDAQRQLLRELANQLGFGSRFRHYPLVQHRGLAKKFDYSIRNNAILLARYDHVLTLDDYEYYRDDMVATVVNSSSPYHYFYLNRLSFEAYDEQSLTVDLSLTAAQCATSTSLADFAAPDQSPNLLAEDDEVDSLFVWNHNSFLRERFVYEFNGICEAATSAYSWDDLELGARLNKAGIRFQRHFEVAYHLDHPKSEARSSAPKPCCLDARSAQPSAYVQDYTAWATAAPSVRVYEEHGYDWFSCVSCGFSGPLVGEDGYLERLRQDTRKKSAIGWVGRTLGRNLAALHEDLQKSNEVQQLDLLAASYTARRYLEPAAD